MIPWSQFNFPWSGDVVQRIDPDFFFGAIPTEAGDGETEKEIFKKASYGRQLGLITEVLLALVEETRPGLKDQESLEKLKKIQATVETIKEGKKENDRTNARRFLDKLKQSDPEALNQLLRQYRSDD